jgi:hypothetical protein
MKLVISVILVSSALCCLAQLGVKTKQNYQNLQQQQIPFEIENLSYDDRLNRYREQHRQQEQHQGEYHYGDRYFRNNSEVNSLNKEFINRTKTEIPKGICFKEVP